VVINELVEYTDGGEAKYWKLCLSVFWPHGLVGIELGLRVIVAGIQPPNPWITFQEHRTTR